MADERFIEIIFDDEEEIIMKIEREGERQRKRVKALLDNLAEIGVLIVRGNVPVYSTYTLRHVDKTAVRWHPGGAGGGGQWEATVGIKAGTSMHPLYAEGGTGIYGRFRRVIRPLSATYMYFYGTQAGRLLRRKTVKGQRGQRYFLESWREMKLYSMQAVRTEGRSIF